MNTYGKSYIHLSKYIYISSSPLNSKATQLLGGKMKQLFFITALFFSFNIFAQSNIREEMKSRENLKQEDLSMVFMTPKDKNCFDLSNKNFEKLYNNKFGGKWTDKNQSSYRVTSLPLAVKPTIIHNQDGSKTYRYDNINGASNKYHHVLGKDNLEAIFTFKEQKLKKISYSFYNKGDAKKLKTLKSIVTETQDFVKLLSSKLDVLFKKKTTTIRLQKKVNFYAFVDEILYNVEVAYTKKAVEYLNFTIEDRRSVLGTSLDSVDKKTVLRAKDLPAKVKRDDNGDIWIDSVPMVDQGQKGYCASATTARILQYYGRDMDQHQVAQISGGTKNGTKPEDLKDAVRRIRSKLKLTMDIIYDMDKQGKSVLREVGKYAKKNGVKMYYNKVYYAQMSNKDVYKDASIATRYYRSYKEDIIEAIDKGIPLAWALMLGLYPEDGKTPQTGGGHMRTIIGYNKEKDSIIFTDTWGAGHEKKYMKFDDSFAASWVVWKISPK
jgi:hypothetical protein